ncbi:MAG TPA: hypothetical protein VIN61_18590 [Gammaproteobacteria bacterium]
MTRARFSTRVLAAALGVVACVPLPDAAAEPFVSVGALRSDVREDAPTAPAKVTLSDSSALIGGGISRRLAGGSEIGVRAELTEAASARLFAVRAFDYRYHLSERLAVTAFLGAARLDLATPAYGYYAGAGMALKNVLPGWDLGIDLRFGDKLARDNVAPGDPQGGPRPDTFYDLEGFGITLTRRFGAAAATDAPPPR